jgi:predicted NBD/HSP70 family sugar kinase
MRFYNRQHRHYCGIDLHVKTMYVCILDTGGQVLVHRNVKSSPEAFLETVAPYRDGLVVAAECSSRGTGSPTYALPKALSSSSVTRSP